MIFDEAYMKFWEKFGESRTMVLSTSLHDIVTSRTISIVACEEKLYFQTDKTFRKCDQLEENPHVALCIDNIQIEGECSSIGRPSEHPDFCKAYERCFPSSYRRYSYLQNERLFCVIPTFIERWIYIDGVPYIEKFEITQKKHTLILYEEFK